MAVVDNKPGIYVGVRFEPETAVMLSLWQGRIKVEKPVPINKLHSTVVFSKEFFTGYEPLGELDTPVLVDAKTYEWKLFGKEGEPKCLVLTFDNEWIRMRNAEAMRLGASSDFPEYVPHVTFSYDYLGDEASLKNLPLPVEPLKICNEYLEPINPEWSKTAASYGLGHQPTTVLEITELNRLFPMAVAQVQDALARYGYVLEKEYRLDGHQTSALWQVPNEDWGDPAFDCTKVALFTETRANTSTLRLQTVAPFNILESKLLVTSAEDREQAILAAKSIRGVLKQNQHETIANLLSVVPGLHLKPIPTLWYENEQGDRYIPDLTVDFPANQIPEEFVYQHSRFGNMLNEMTLRMVRDPEGGSRSERVMEGSSSWSEELAMAIHRNEGMRLQDAIVIAASCCSRCMNMIGHKYGLPGYGMENDYRWDMHCEVCEQVDPDWHNQYLILDNKRRMNRRFYDNLRRMIQETVPATDEEPVVVPTDAPNAPVSVTSSYMSKEEILERAKSMQVLDPKKASIRVNMKDGTSQDFFKWMRNADTRLQHIVTKRIDIPNISVKK